MQLFGFAFVKPLFRVYFSTGGEIKQKHKGIIEARAVQLSSAGWVGLKNCVFFWGVGSMRVTLTGSQGEFALMCVCLNEFY